jgi:phosphonate transport system ATP-binding protein
MLGPEVQPISPAASGAAAPGAPLVIEGVRKSFGTKQVLDGVDLTLRNKEIIAILGPNGCGKSTLLRCAIGLVKPDAGEIRLRGQELAALRGKALRTARREAAVIFQQIALVGRRSAIDNVCCGALGRLPLRRSFSPYAFPEEVRERAAYALARVGMLEQAWQPAATLSGGQAQRVAIARAYCQQASVILADEPVSALDPRAAEEVLQLLADLAHNDGLAVLAVLHQPALALKYADRVIGMRLGQFAFNSKPADVGEEQIEALYHHLKEV